VNRRSDVLAPADLEPTDVLDLEQDFGAVAFDVNLERRIAGTAEVFALLSDPGRLRLLAVLRAGEAHVGELAARAGLSESATSHALRLLRAHGVVEVRRTGRRGIYRLADAHVADLLDIGLAHAAHGARG
jgi:DNA-binding transcriptional ArsR family regulator